MKTSDPHQKSRRLRRFKPNRKPAGIFCIGVTLADTALLVLAFFVAVSPFILQPGINISLPPAPFTGGARFDSLVLAITRGGELFFDDQRVAPADLAGTLEAAAAAHPGAPLIIEADERVPQAVVVRAWNAARRAGIEKVSIATRIAALREDLP